MIAGDTLFDVCASRHAGNAQSRAAFAKVRPKLAGLRARILAYISACDSHGATVEELSDRLHLRYTTVSARVSELKRDGFIEQSADLFNTRKTSTGNPAAVMVATRKALQ